MRGAQYLILDFIEYVGIIPADAGSTAMHARYLRQGGDHPRGCGEHDASDGATLTVTGSSPRMRGARVVEVHGRPIVGIIPADAGSTYSDPSMFAFAWDHPRGCGEHHLPAWGCGLERGSSPRMRGARNA